MKKKDIQLGFIGLTIVVIMYVVYKISYSDYYLEDGTDLIRTRMIAYGIFILGMIWIFFFEGLRKFDRGNYVHITLAVILLIAIMYLDMIRSYARRDRRQAGRSGSISL